ncbi:MAG: type II methionyl aminopeptidase [Candidatus Helarchaeota archaeon]
MEKSDEIYEKYFESGRVLANALDKTKSIIKPGMKLIDICNFAENEILKHGAQLAFPLNIGINEIAAHYSSPINDKSTIPDECLVKLDLGASIDGFLTDSAITVNVGGNEELERFIIAAESALSSAIKEVRAGVRVNELGEIVEKVINKFNLKPIRNLSGHQMTQYNLHAGISVPNIKSNDMGSSYKFKDGDVFAIEPFSTDGMGAVYSGNKTYIYALMKKKSKNLPAHISRLLNRIWNERRKLPFSTRWYKDIPNHYIKQLLRMNILYKYPVLVEANGGKVAQAEHTIIVHNDSCTIITKN